MRQAAVPAVFRVHPGGSCGMIVPNTLQGRPINQSAPINLSQAAPLPRARGTIDLRAKRRGGDSVIADFRASGSMKMLFPHGRGATLNAVFLNTAGGMTGGDRFEIAAEAGPAARLTPDHPGGRADLWRGGPQPCAVDHPVAGGGGRADRLGPARDHLL